MTNTTDIAALREACGILNDHGYLTKSGKIRSNNLAEAVRMIIEQSVGYAGQLEEERHKGDLWFGKVADLEAALKAERQRAAGSEEELHKALHREKAVERKLLAAQEELAALKAKLANPVVLPSGYTARSGHPFHEGERNVMIPHKQGDWLSRFDVEHAVHVAGFPFTVKGE